MPTTYKVNFKTTTLIYEKADDFSPVFSFYGIDEKQLSLTIYSLIFLMNHLPIRSISFNASGSSSSGKLGV